MILKSDFYSLTWVCQFHQMIMTDNTNSLTLSESAINDIKKSELVQKILSLKGKIIVVSDITNIIFNLGFRCNQISKLNETVTQLESTNKKK